MKLEWKRTASYTPERKESLFLNGTINCFRYIFIIVCHLGSHIRSVCCCQSIPSDSAYSELRISFNCSLILIKTTQNKWLFNTSFHKMYRSFNLHLHQITWNNKLLKCELSYLIMILSLWLLILVWNASKTKEIRSNDIEMIWIKSIKCKSISVSEFNNQTLSKIWRTAKESKQKATPLGISTTPVWIETSLSIALQMEKNGQHIKSKWQYTMCWTVFIENNMKSILQWCLLFRYACRSIKMCGLSF